MIQLHSMEILLMKHERISYPDAFAIYRTSDRQRLGKWVERFKNTGAFMKTTALLDLGCGVGRFTHPLSNLVHRAYAVDHDMSMLLLASQCNSSNISWICADATALPLSDDTVDVILASMILGHVASPERLFAEMRRVLRNSGLILLRTMLPDDFLYTTWYEYIPEALERDRSRAIPYNRIASLMHANGMTIKTTHSFIDEVERSTSKDLPDRIEHRSYEILQHIGEDVIKTAADRIRDAMRSYFWTETLGSSLLECEHE